MQIFISYSSKDNVDAFKLCEYLESNGKNCFIAPRNIQPGREYGEEIIHGIDASDGMVLLLSENSNKSPHVLREIERAVSKKIPIYVHLLEQVELTKSMEYFLMSHQWGSTETENDFSKILEWTNGFSKKSSKEEQVKTPTKESKKKSIGPKLIGVVVALLLILVLCVGVFWARNHTFRTVDVETGDTILLGTYNGEPIEWRVLKVEEEQAVLVSKNILTMKAYDAAESGKYNYVGEKDYWSEQVVEDLELQVQIRGNSDWSVSNIRTWLNSDKEVVSYSDQEPEIKAMAEYKNGYDNEPGFLHGFTEKELTAIVETEVITTANALADSDSILTKDKVYLLSKDELGWFDEAGISKYAVPTQSAIEQDESNWYDVDKSAYGVEEYYWWLREPVADASSKCYMVGNGYWEEDIIENVVGLEGFGIRPAITVDLTSDYLWELYGVEE